MGSSISIKFIGYLSIGVLVSVLVFLQTFLSYTIIQRLILRQINADLIALTTRIKSDLRFDNGKWDTRMYLSDPQTPHPHGSSGYSEPLYIITDEGFVIERNLPITGLLDSSDFKHLLEFTNPTYVQGATNERWRVLSKKLENESAIVGVVFVSAYNPSDQNISEVDRTLVDVSSQIANKITYRDNEINVSKIDIRDIKYDISFEIVTSYNKVLLNNGRSPSFIDSSYVYDEIRNGDRIVRDRITRVSYLIKTIPLIDISGSTQGIVVAGISLRELETLLRSFLRVMFFIGSFAVIIFTILMMKFIKSHDGFILRLLDILREQKVFVRNVTFNSKDSYLLIDSQKFMIPYASNQYYLCKALFSYPQKRWEQDELLEKLGEEQSIHNTRKVYDAALAINKKTGIKVVRYSDKTYQLNPKFISSRK